MKPRFISPTQAKNPREAAYLAALAADREQAFISDALSEWADAKQPSSSEMGLATLIANVACREANSLDYAIRVLAEGGEEGGKEEKGKNKGKRGKSVRLKGRQRVVLRTALAQYKWVLEKGGVEGGMKGAIWEGPLSRSIQGRMHDLNIA